MGVCCVATFCVVVRVFVRARAGLTAVSPLMLCDGFLVSVTWTEPRMRLKLADVLHSTVTEKEASPADRLFSGFSQRPHWGEPRI